MASALVQSKVGILTFTFDATPTDGNLIVVALSGRSGQSHDETDKPVLTDGYTFRAKYENVDATYRRTLYVFTKKAGASESATVTAVWTSGTGTETFAGVELSGIDGDFIDSDVSSSGDASSLTWTTGSIAGSGNRAGLAILGLKYDASDGVHTTTYDNYTKDTEGLEGDTGLNTVPISFGHLDYTASTAISETASWTDSITTNSGTMAVLLAWNRDAGGGSSGLITQSYNLSRYTGGLT